MHENDSAPTTTQQHFAQRIHRGINNMYSYESLPRWLTPSNVGIQAVGAHDLFGMELFTNLWNRSKSAGIFANAKSFMKQKDHPRKKG